MEPHAQPCNHSSKPLTSSYPQQLLQPTCTLSVSSLRLAIACIQKKTKYLFYFTLDRVLQPGRHFRHTHTDWSKWSCDSRSYPGVAMLNVVTLNWWGTSSKREGDQRKLHVVDSQLSGGNCLSHVLVKKGWVGGGANNVQEAWLESTMGINLWSPATSYPVSICVACSFLMIFSRLLIHAHWRKSGQCMHSSSGVWNSHLMS